MAEHLLAWTEAIDNVSDYEINRVADSIMTQPTSKRNSVPIGLNVLDWVYYVAPSFSRARVFAASAEKRRQSLYVLPYKQGFHDDSGVQYISTLHTGYKFDETEDISVRVTYPDVPAAERAYAFVSLSDGKESPIPEGDRVLVRCTGNTSLVPNEWTPVVVTPEIQLEAGNYALVRFFGFTGNGIAVRAVVQGNPYRAGYPALNGANEFDGIQFNSRLLEILKQRNHGVFTHRAVPQFEFFSAAADTSETVYMELVKLS